MASSNSVGLPLPAISTAVSLGLIQEPSSQSHQLVQPSQPYQEPPVMGRESSVHPQQFQTSMFSVIPPVSVPGMAQSQAGGVQAPGVLSLPVPPPSPPSPNITSKLNNFWQEQLGRVLTVSDEHWRTPEFPLARIKKIMRMDEDVRMISAEVPIIFSRAVEMFVSELSMRAWQVTDESKRRTVQRSDIAMAITKNDMFDFLIDIVPREEINFKQKFTPKYSEGSGENLQLIPPELLQMFIHQLGTGSSSEDESSANVQNILQQLLHIQQLQEQQIQAQSSASSMGALSSSDPSTSASGAILDTQVLQASNTPNTTTSVLDQISSGDYQLLEQMNATQLLESNISLQQPIISAGQPVDAHPGLNMGDRIDSLTSDVLRSVDPLQSQAISSSTYLPAEFASSLDESRDDLDTTGALDSNNIVAFKSTPLNLKH